MANRRFWALVLCVALFLPAVGWASSPSWRVTFSGAESDAMSPGAVEALNCFFAKLSLCGTLTEDGYDCTFQWEGSPLLTLRGAASGTVLACSGLTAAAPSPLPEGMTWPLLWPEKILSLAGQVGALLSDWEKEGSYKTDLRGAGTAASRLNYTLTGEEWAQVWPDMVSLLLPAVRSLAGEPLTEAVLRPILEGMQVSTSGTATVRRFFNRSGEETGCYFYGKRIAFADGTTREVSFTLGFVADTGLYVSFRCPATRGTHDVRLTLDCRKVQKKNVPTWSVEGEFQQLEGSTKRTVQLEASLALADGWSGTINATHRFTDGSQTETTLFTLNPRFTPGQDGWEVEADFTWSPRKQKWLGLTAHLENAPAADADPAMAEEGSPDASAAQVQEAFSAKLLTCLFEAAPREDALQLLAAVAALAGQDTSPTVPVPDEAALFPSAPLPNQTSNPVTEEEPNP